MARASLPPGFRFHPTDVELVKYYLKRKVMGKGFPFEAISELNIYNYCPRDLPEKSCLKSKDLEWYFFCPSMRKYASGVRANRATEDGYWKSTGKDRSVLYKEQTVGMVKTLVYHIGHAPKGQRTNWVMYEYKIQEQALADAGVPQDAYVLCKIFQKSGPGPKANANYGAPFNEEEWDDNAELCDQSLQSNSLPPPVLPYVKENSIGTSMFIPENMGSAPLSMPGYKENSVGTSMFIPESMDYAPLIIPGYKENLVETSLFIPASMSSAQLLTHGPANILPTPASEIDDFISLCDFDKQHGPSLPNHTFNNELVQKQNFNQEQVMENISEENNNDCLTGLRGNGIYDNLGDLSQENNNGGLIGLHGNGIYDNLRDLDTSQGLGASTFDFSSNQPTEYGVIPIVGANPETFLELNDLDFPVDSVFARQFMAEHFFEHANDNYIEQDHFPADSVGSVEPVSTVTQLPLRSEGSNNGQNGHFFAFQEMGHAESANLGFTASTGIENLPPSEQPEDGTRNAVQDQNRGVEQRKPCSRFQLLLESIPARNASAAELFAPTYGGSSFHVKAEVKRKGGTCTKDALSDNLGEFPYSYSGFGKKVVKRGSHLRVFFGLDRVSTFVCGFLVIIASKCGIHAWNFVNS